MHKVNGELNHIRYKFIRFPGNTRTLQDPEEIEQCISNSVTMETINKSQDDNHFIETQKNNH